MACFCSRLTPRVSVWLGTFKTVNLLQMDMAKWCTIESDPCNLHQKDYSIATFALLIKKIGAEGVQVEEVYDLGDLQLLPYEYNSSFNGAAMF